MILQRWMSGRCCEGGRQGRVKGAISLDPRLKRTAEIAADRAEGGLDLA